MARWRTAERSNEPMLERLCRFDPDEWSDAAAQDDHLLGPDWRPSQDFTAAQWRALPEARRTSLRWVGAWLLWHDGEDVDLVDAVRARMEAKRAAAGLPPRPTWSDQ